MPKRKAGLTAKQSAFCREYIKDHNGTQAAIRAKYSKNRASEIAWQLLQKTTIQEEIKRLEQKSGQTDEGALIDRARILREWNKIAFRNAKTIYNESDEMKPMSEISEEDAACIAEVMELQTEIGHSRKVKFFSKEAALKELSKMGGLYPEEGTGEGVKLEFYFGSDK